MTAQGKPTEGPDREGKASSSEELERLAHLARLAAIGRLTAAVAHEISTPLASITLRAESLNRSSEDPALVAVGSFKNFPRYLKSIAEEALRCKEILSRLMAFARPPGEEPRPVDLNSIAEQAGQLLRHEMMRRRVSLELKCEPGLPPVEAREASLGQAILALLLNALDGSVEGGKVTLETARRGPDAVSLAVEDEGGGIPREHLDRIFDPTSDPATDGPGLGLTVCRMVAAAQGGDARAEAATGRGSRFVLTLPLRAPRGGG